MSHHGEQYINYFTLKLMEPQGLISQMHPESSPTTIEKTILCCSAQGTSFSDIPDITDMAKASFQRHETHLGDFEITISGFIYVECSPK
jgi:hypothetical protein